MQPGSAHALTSSTNFVSFHTSANGDSLLLTVRIVAVGPAVGSGTTFVSSALALCIDKEPITGVLKDALAIFN